MTQLKDKKVQIIVKKLNQPSESALNTFYTIVYKHAFETDSMKKDQFEN